jgi:hypothetical protein
MMIVLSFAAYPFIIVPGAIFLNLDPFYALVKLLQKFIPFFSISGVSLILHIIRVIMMSIAVAEVCRSIALIMLLLISAVRTANIILENMLSTTTVPQHLCLGQMINIHTRLELAIQLVALAQEGLCICGLFIGLVGGIVFNYGTVKFYSVFPFYIYVYFPCISIYIVCVYMMMLTMGHSVLDKSKELGRLLPLSLFKNTSEFVLKKKTKEMRKILRSMRPLRLYAGIGGTRFFYFQCDTKVTVFYEAINYTISLLLSIPNELVDEFEAHVISQLS